MANIFERMQKRLFDLTTTVFGYKAVWLASSNRPIDVEGDVNYRQPNEKDMIRSNGEYMPMTYFMEYREPFFEGLYNAVRDNGVEFVSIVDQYDVTHYYAVRSIKAQWDGKTYHAFLEELKDFEPWRPEPGEGEDEEEEENGDGDGDTDPSLTLQGRKVENSEEHPCISDFTFNVDNEECDHPNERV